MAQIHDCGGQSCKKYEWTVQRNTMSDSTRESDGNLHPLRSSFAKYHGTSCVPVVLQPFVCLAAYSSRDAFLVKRPAAGEPLFQEAYKILAGFRTPMAALLLGPQEARCRLDELENDETLIGDVRRTPECISLYMDKLEIAFFAEYCCCVVQQFGAVRRYSALFGAIRRYSALFGAVQRGSAWFGAVRRGSAWFGVVRRGSAWFGVVRRGSAWFGVVRRGSAWFGVVRRGSAWFSVVRRGSAWFGVIRRDSARVGEVRRGLARFGEVEFAALTKDTLTGDLVWWLCSPTWMSCCECTVYIMLMIIIESNYSM